MNVLKLKKEAAPSPTPELGVVLNRIASATSVIRTRAEHVRRDAANGGSPADVFARFSAAAADLERVAARLESSVA